VAEPGTALIVRTLASTGLRLGESANWQLLVEERYAKFPDGLVGCTPSSRATDARTHAASWNFAALAPGVRTLPVLIITSDDGLAPDTDTLADEIVRHGGAARKRIHMATDHAYSDHRIELQRVVVAWLQADLSSARAPSN
jgi:hypothetical protein